VHAEPYVCAEEPNTCGIEPCVCVKEPNNCAKVPYQYAKSPLHKQTLRRMPSCNALIPPGIAKEHDTCGTEPRICVKSPIYAPNSPVNALKCPANAPRALYRRQRLLGVCFCNNPQPTKYILICTHTKMCVDMHIYMRMSSKIWRYMYMHIYMQISSKIWRDFFLRVQHRPSSMLVTHVLDTCILTFMWREVYK